MKIICWSKQMITLKIKGLYGGRHYAKTAVFRSTEKSVNYQDIFDCPVSSGQPTGIKIAYLTQIEWKITKLSKKVTKYA